MSKRKKSVLSEEDIKKLKNGNFTEEDVEKNINVTKNEQIWFLGTSIGTAKNEYQLKECKKRIKEIVCNPDIDTFIGLQKFRTQVYGKMLNVFPKYYPIRYQGGQGHDLINALNHKDKWEPFIFMDAEEILDAAKMFKHGKTSTQVGDMMIRNPYYECTHSNMSQEDLDLFEEYYRAGKMNRIIRWICTESEKVNGFRIYSTNKVLFYLNPEDYVFRKGDTGNE